MSKKNKTMVSVEDKLKALHKLQIIDTEIDKIRIVRGELPLEIQDLEDLILGLNTRLDKFNDELNILKDGVVAHTNSISVSKEAIKKYEKQLKNIKNNREFTSLTKEVEFQNLEIQLSEKKRSEIEANILHKNEIINLCKEQLSDKQSELDVKKGELLEITKETEKEEKKFLKESSKAQEVIDQRLLNAYKRIRSKVANGLAVVSVERDACGGCFSQIPPQRQLDIQMHKKIIVCEHCGRIMIDKNVLES